MFRYNVIIIIITIRSNVIITGAEFLASNSVWLVCMSFHDAAAVGNMRGWLFITNMKGLGRTLLQSLSKRYPNIRRDRLIKTTKTSLEVNHWRGRDSSRKSLLRRQLTLFVSLVAPLKLAFPSTLLNTFTAASKHKSPCP